MSFDIDYASILNRGTFLRIKEIEETSSLKIIFVFAKDGDAIRPQIGSLTFLKIFVLEVIYSGRSQHSEPSYAILYYWG